MPEILPDALVKMRLFSDGTPMLIARPTRAKLAVKIARKAIGTKNWDKAQKRMNEECGPYTFVGYASLSGTEVLNAEGVQIDTVRPGDSFVDIDFWGYASPGGA